jgi:hypothetical protein
MPDPDSGLRARVERLLRGDVQPVDLDRLFLYARDRCDGRESVQEVGDFVAHHDERTKGILTRCVQDWYISSRFHFYMMDKPQGPDPNNLPANFDSVLWASFRRADAKEISRVIGLRRAEVNQLLPAITKGLRRNLDGSMALNNFYTRQELRIINGLSKMLIARPAFDNDRLFSDFAATLRSHGLLGHSELKAFNDLKPVIGLFSIAIMHNSTIRLNDGTTIRLKVNDAVGAQKLTVCAPVQVSVMRGSPIFVATAMFATEIDAQQGCTAELLAIPDPWDFDIELLTHERLLSKLG